MTLRYSIYIADKNVQHRAIPQSAAINILHNEGIFPVNPNYIAGIYGDGRVEVMAEISARKG